MTGISTTRLDCGGGAEQVADFSFHDDEGHRLGLLEVTSIPDEVLLRLEAALAMQESGRTHAPRLLEGSNLFWIISIQAHKARVKEIQLSLPGILRELEQTYPTGFIEQVVEPDLRHWQPTTTSIPEEENKSLYRLGITAVHAFSGQGYPGGIEYSRHHSTAGATPNAMTDAINDILWLQDNRKKLSSADHDQRRDLFIWVDRLDLNMVLYHSIDASMAEFYTPAKQPTLPPEVTTVWVAAQAYRPDGGALWLSDGGPWTVTRWPPPVN